MACTHRFLPGHGRVAHINFVFASARPVVCNRVFQHLLCRFSHALQLGPKVAQQRSARLLVLGLLIIDIWLVDARLATAWLADA